MITLRLATPSESKQFFSELHVNTQENGIIIYETEIDSYLDYTKKLRTAKRDIYLYTENSRIPLLAGLAANSVYYRPLVNSIFTNIDEAKTTLETSNYISYRFYVEDSKKIYDYEKNGDEITYTEDVGVNGSFCIVGDIINNIQRYLLYYNGNWNIYNKETDISKHIADKNNPHKVTKEQIGLGNVLNIEQASQKEFYDHVYNYNNPHKTTKKDVELDNVSNETQVSKKIFESHIKNNQNPHYADKVMIGLENVGDFPQLPDTDLTDHIKTVLAHEETAETIGLENVPNILQATREDLDAHINTDNAHELTKEQVGFGNVPNVLQATEEEFNAHVNNQNNPHNVTKEDLGLGNLSDEEQGSPEDFTNHIINTTNPHKVTKEQIGLENVIDTQQLSKNDFDAHANNESNPHNITKATIGLDKVRNIKSVSKTDFDAHATNYDNPHKVTLAQLGLDHFDPSIPQFPADEWENHISDMNNPHKVTLAQLGLDQVLNIDHVSEDDLLTHINDNNNPHNTTKENIGLGNVDNTKDLDKPLSDIFITVLSGKILKSYQIDGEDVPLIGSDGKIDKRYLDELLGNFLGIIDKDNHFLYVIKSESLTTLPAYDDKYADMYVINADTNDILLYNRKLKKIITWNNNIDQVYDGSKMTIYLDNTLFTLYGFSPSTSFFHGALNTAEMAVNTSKKIAINSASGYIKERLSDTHIKISSTNEIILLS